MQIYEIKPMHKRKKAIMKIISLSIQKVDTSTIDISTVDVLANDFLFWIFCDKMKFLSLWCNASSSHNICIFLERGMRPESVIKITGHSDFKIMKKYARLTENVVVQEIANIWHEISP